ncbi:hypothetical protein PV328_007864 [Microctonus aethiopoides]|uniref:Uncharacterized protein n=1 Tax=Microctonus aethiopoides TaxID=144406 RepID=A0AA39F0U9_9HYME|nr:hypothetical protein PV328_007864 [Microctonus aethiopoides]
MLDENATVNAPICQHVRITWSLDKGTICLRSGDSRKSSGAGDLNTRNTIWGDKVTNERGTQLQSWEMQQCINNKAIFYPSKNPTFPSSGSYLNYCIADTRIKIGDSTNGRINTKAYDSDHNAITFEIETTALFNGLTNIEQKITTFNFRNANWRKFSEHIETSLTVDSSVPHNRNLTIEEIDKYIVKSEEIIMDAINKTIPKNERKNSIYHKYDNNIIKKLHADKSKLITILFKIISISKRTEYRNEVGQIKNIIKVINKELNKEFKRTVTAYWEAQVKEIDYRKSKEFFPKINKLLRTKPPLKIDNIKLKINNDEFNDKIYREYQHLEYNNEIIISEPTEKLEVIGKFLEKIYSKRYTNEGTEWKKKSRTNSKQVQTNVNKQ